MISESKSGRTTGGTSSAGPQGRTPDSYLFRQAVLELLQEGRHAL